MVAFYRLKELDYRLPTGAHVLPRASVEPLETATALLADAEARAAAIVAQAESGYRAECERGYAEGHAQGRLEALDELLGETAALDARLRAVEGDLARLVAACVRKLVDGFDDVARAEAVVRGALKQMRREKKAELRVASSQFAHFRAAADGIAKEFPEIDLIDVVEDPTLVAPQVIVETPIGRVEGDFGRRLAELEQIILRTAEAAAAAPDDTAARPS